MPKGSKTTVREHLKEVWKITGKQPRQLAEIPAVDSSAAWLLRLFYELFSGEILTWAELRAWVECNRVPLNPNELNLMRKASIAYLNNRDAAQNGKHG